MSKAPPKEIIGAAAGMLAAYFPELTADKLVAGILHEIRPDAVVPAADPGELLTVAEFCRRAKLTRQAVYNFRKAKRIRAVKIGRSVRIPVCELVRIASGAEG